MGKNTKPQTEAAAQPAASTADPAPRQSADTAAEAGLPQTQPEQQPEKPAFNADLYAAFLSEQSDEDFNAAFEVMLAEAHDRGIVGTEADEQPTQPATAEAEAEAEPSEEDRIRELLQRHKLKQAWQAEDGTYYFDEKAAQVANATTIITLENVE